MSLIESVRHLPARHLAGQFLAGLCLLLSSSLANAQPTATSWIEGTTVKIAFGTGQIKADSFPAAQKAVFALIVDPAPARPLLVDAKLEIEGINQVKVNLLCPDGVTAVDPKGGAECIKLPALPGGSKASRTVLVNIEKLQFEGEQKPFREIVRVVIANEVPHLSTTDIKQEGADLPISIHHYQRVHFLEAVAGKLSQVKVRFEFGEGDYLPAFNVAPIRIGCVKGAPTVVLLTLPDGLPKRPDKYTVKVTFPKSLFVTRPIEEDLTVTFSQEAFKPAATDDEAKKKSAYWVEATLRSFVDPSVNQGNRRWSGLLAYSLRPAIAPKVLKEGRTVGVWRPTFAANVSTDPLRELVKSGAPTQLQHGLEYEIIQNHFASDAKAPWLAQSLVTVGIRHESDRDFKFQTVFSRFGYSPLIRGWSQSRDYRIATRGGIMPRLSAFSVVPTVSFDAGGVVRDRLERLIPFPLITDQLVRMNTELAMEFEIGRFAKLTAKDTYSYLWKLPRRPHRNFLTTGLEINTGYLLIGTPLNGFQNALVFKFERGEQTPTYKSVNSFSVGFKVYR